MNSFSELYSELYDELEIMPFTDEESYLILRRNPNKYLIMDNINESQYIPYEPLTNTVSILKYSFEDLHDAELCVKNICKNKSDIGFYSIYTPLDNSYRIYMTTFNDERCKFLLINRMNAWHVIRLYTTYWSIPRIEETLNRISYS